MESKLNFELRKVLEMYGIDHSKVVGKYNLLGHLASVAKKHGAKNG